MSTENAQFPSFLALPKRRSPPAADSLCPIIYLMLHWTRDGTAKGKIRAFGSNFHLCIIPLRHRVLRTKGVLFRWFRFIVRICAAAIETSRPRAISIFKSSDLSNLKARPVLRVVDGDTTDVEQENSSAVHRRGCPGDRTS